MTTRGRVRSSPASSSSSTRRSSPASSSTRRSSPSSPACEPSRHLEGITYQHKLIKCGKKTCSRLHGPYWYAYWRDGKTIKCKYIGKQLPDEVTEALDALDV